MARAIEIFDTTLRDGNKLPFVVLSVADRVVLARQLARLGVDVIETGFPSASTDEAECVTRICREVEGPFVAALARAIPADVDAALECLRGSRKPYLHVYMSVSPQFLAQVLREKEAGALRNISECITRARAAKVRVQFSLSEAPHARKEFLREACVAAREAGADVINLADTNGILVPEDAAALVVQAREAIGAAQPPVVGIHCHNDLGLATANSMAAVRAGASHVEVTLGGFGERAGNAALEEIVFLISAFGERYGLSHHIHLEEIARTSHLFDSLTGIRTHPNKPVVGSCAFMPAPGGFAGKALDPSLRNLLSPRSIGDDAEHPPIEPVAPDTKPLYELESFNVLTSSHSPPVGVVVIRRDGKTLTQTSHGTEVIVTAELRGRRFHGRFRSTDVIEASLRAYLLACNEIGESRILEGPQDFHVAGEYLWE
jgi:2-isopropylmalate synthase